MNENEPTFIFEQQLQEAKKQRVFRRRLILAFLAIVLAVSGYVTFFLFVPPPSFPTGTIFEIPDGATLSEAAEMLEEKGIVRSAVALHAYIVFVKYDHPVISGSYLLTKEEPLAVIAERIVSGEFHIEKLKILIPEGFDAWSLTKALSSAMPTFESEKFLSIAMKEEGYLFPDTYFFFTTAHPEDVAEKMRENFDDKLAPLSEKITASGHSVHDIITMASIIERETITPEDRRIVSGILWKRIKLGMPLQVDAAFNYVNGKNTYELSINDLKIDSPYNTYVHKGLPPGPICNPGLDPILAALEPTETPYLYYLSGKDGTMHYAKTFEEHKKNKLKYLQ